MPLLLESIFPRAAMKKWAKSKQILQMGPRKLKFASVGYVYAPFLNEICFLNSFLIWGPFSNLAPEVSQIRSRTFLSSKVEGNHFCYYYLPNYLLMISSVKKIILNDMLPN